MTVLLFSAALLAGCTRAPAETVTSATVAPSALRAMSPAARKMAFPAEFPLEIPVADGHVLGSVAATQTTAGLYSYDLAVDASPAQTLDWYRTVYLGANWQQVGEERSGGALVALSFAKGGLGSIVRAEAADSGTSVHVDFGDRGLVEQQTF